MNYLTDYQIRKKQRSDTFVRKMEEHYNIKEITTKIQARNGTRSFLSPCGGKYAVYKSGMVRKIIKTTLFNQYSCWQLNKTFTQEQRHSYVGEYGEIKTNKYTSKSRILVRGEIGRLTYLLNHLIKNRGVKVLYTLR